MHSLWGQEHLMLFYFFIPNLTLDSTAAFIPSDQMFQTRPEAGQRNKIPAIKKAAAGRLKEKTEIRGKLENKSSGLTK